MKTNKSWTSRLKVTKNGKVKRRNAGQNHFNAKESGNVTRSKRRGMDFKVSKKVLSRFMGTSGK